MKLSTNWLREYVDMNLPLGELAAKLTMAGLEVEEIHEYNKQRFVENGGDGLADDTVFDVKITPNRGDWLSMIGVAREVAPIVGGKAKLPDPKIDESKASDGLIKINIENPELCGRYVGIVVRGIKIKESPGWLKDRLIASGMRPINNVVDITNYVMMELGQPLHAFDYNKLQGQQVIVRTARPDEVIVSIDDEERKLEPNMLVIADSSRPVALAGVMGGKFSEISEQTQDILIESANFNAVSIRRTSKRLNMVTESSYRFERGVDPSITVIAAKRTAELICELAGGYVAQSVLDVRPTPVEPLVIEARPERVNAVLGASIPQDAMVEYLNAYEISAQLTNGKLRCVVPTFRQDITREIDIVEEVGRGYGYENFDMTLPAESLRGHDSPTGVFRDKVRRILMTCGAQEALTHSIVDSRLAKLAGKDELMVTVRNPLAAELDSMRSMLAPNLLQVIGRNQAFGTPDVNVFEIGKIYYKDAAGNIGETLAIAGAMVGDMWRSAWSLPESALEVDFFTCKGVVENLLADLGIPGATYCATKHPMLHPTRAAEVKVGDKTIGILGEANPDVREALDVRGRPCMFEMDFNTLMEIAPNVLKYTGVPRYPALARHINVVVSDEVTYEGLKGIVLKNGGDLVEDVDLLDIYKGEQIGEGKRSLTMSIVFRSAERTLRDEEVNEVLGNIREALQRAVEVSFR